MGNFFKFANVKQSENRYIIRQERIKREGSQYYTYPPGIIAATEMDVLIPSTYFPASKKYEPLDFLEIVNNDVVNLHITINGHDNFVCLAGTIRTIENMPLWEIRITNDDAAVDSTAGRIVLTLQRQPLTMDRWIRNR